MKKFFFFAAAAAIAMTACTKTQTTAVSEGNVIKFSNAFVDNVTKADLDNTTIKSFWVFGEYNSETTTWVPLFNNVEVKGTATGTGNVWTPVQTAYWKIDKSHAFGAYANGTSSLAEGVAFDPAAKKLTFADYAAGANDLIAATSANNLTWGGEGDAPAVGLTFKHLLSKVKFTFQTGAADTYTMAVSELKVTNAVKTASVDFTDNVVGTWAGTATGEDVEAYNFGGVTDFAVTGGSAASEVRYVIPQTGTDAIEVSFMVTLSDESGVLKTGNFAGTLAVPAANKWVAGSSYNYTVNIEPDDVDDTLKPILFEVTTVEGWAQDTNVPTTVQ